MKAIYDRWLASTLSTTAGQDEELAATMLAGDRARADARHEGVASAPAAKPARAVAQHV